jgi:prepilin-type N-terminal cleavage/methylation domain-containing protein
MRGFTFIEMMVVIFIISLAATLVVANMDGLTARSTLSSAGRDMGNRLMFLRDIAVVQGREMSLEIDFDQQGWRWVDRPSVTEIPDDSEREEATFYGTFYELADGVILEEIAFGRDDVESGDKFELTFSESGELFPSGFVAYLRHEKLPEEDGLSIEVSGLTGIVSYHRGHIEAEEVRAEHDF